MARAPGEAKNYMIPKLGGGGVGVEGGGGRAELLAISFKRNG